MCGLTVGTLYAVTSNIDIVLDGVYIGLGLWAVAQPIFNFFLFSMTKTRVVELSAARSKTFLAGVAQYVLALLMAVIAFYVDYNKDEPWKSTTNWRYLDYFLCVFPMYTGQNCLIKGVYRPAFAYREKDGKIDIDPYGANGVGPEIIGLGAQIVVYTILLVISETYHARITQYQSLPAHQPSNEDGIKDQYVI